MKKTLALILCALFVVCALPFAFADNAVEIKEITCVDWQNMATNPGEYAPELGFDGDLNTRVSIDIDSADGEYVLIELKEAANVTGLDISWNNGHTRYYTIKVETSMDGKTFKTVFDGDTGVATEAKGFDLVSFDATDAKFIKLTCFGKTDIADFVYDTFDPANPTKINAWLTFWEVKVMASGKAVAAAAPATTAAPTTTAAPVTAAPTTAAPAVVSPAPKTADVSVAVAAVLAAAAAGYVVLRRKR